MTTPDRPETADIETSSDAYAARFAGPVGEWMLGVQERITVSMLVGMPGATVLDVGGGHGQLALPLCRLGFRVTVLGSDEGCARRLAPVLADGTCKFVAGNVVALPFPQDAFDVVISFRLLPHCAAWPVLLREMARVARRVVVVDYPASQGFNALAPALFGAKKKLEGNTREWRMFTHTEVDGELARHGMTLQRREGQFFLPMVLHRALRCYGLSNGLETLCRGMGLTRRWGSPVIASYAKRGHE